MDYEISELCCSASEIKPLFENLKLVFQWKSESYKNVLVLTCLMLMMIVSTSASKYEYIASLCCFQNSKSC